MTEPAERKTTRKRNLLFFSLVVAALIAAGALAYPQARTQWLQPLGPGLELPTYTPVAQASLRQVLPSSTPTRPLITPGQPTATDAPTLTPTATATATPEPLCGGPATMVVLAIGADSGLDYNYGLADVVRIVRVDFVNAKVTALSLPRDLWVQIPEISARGITEGKLNQAYFYGSPGMGYYDGPGAGPGLLARTLDQNFDLRVDHYGAVNMFTFVKIVDAVGGIDVHLEADVDGTPVDKRTDDMGYFTAGNHHLTGEAALRLSRVRKRYSDFARRDNQTLVLCALREKLLTPAVVPKIPKIINAFQDSVLTDLSPAQLGQLACLLPYVKSENLIFTSLPEEIYQAGKIFNPNYEDTTFALQADPDVVRDYIDRFLDGSWPDKPKEPSCP
ncbi:MAG TPA: LCP family protein [Anaerolineales bacterium]|nr:LCP family protein [Anaerolineales bacterium]